MFAGWPCEVLAFGLTNRPSSGHVTVRGVATEWTGVDMSTPLLPKVVPEIDANPVSFFLGRRELGSVMVWSLTKYRE